MNIPVKILYSFLAWVSCATSPKHPEQRPVEHLRVRMTSYRIANNKATAYFSYANNIWYQDSFGITEIRRIQSVQKDSKDTLYTVIIGYRFTDMRKKWAYEYENFSDTAQIVHTFSNIDTLVLVGGWNFFRRAFIKFDSLRAIGDTVIGGITYQKHRFMLYTGGITRLSEALSRCDRKGTIFQIDVGLSRAIGCPQVKGTSLTPDGRFPMSSSEIEFVSNEFPDSVRRVFAAWKRNVQQYPVE